MKKNKPDSKKNELKALRKKVRKLKKKLKQSRKAEGTLWKPDDRVSLTGRYPSKKHLPLFTDKEWNVLMQGLRTGRFSAKGTNCSTNTNAPKVFQPSPQATDPGQAKPERPPSPFLVLDEKHRAPKGDGWLSDDIIQLAADYLGCTVGALRSVPYLHQLISFTEDNLPGPSLCRLRVLYQMTEGLVQKQTTEEVLAIGEKLREYVKGLAGEEKKSVAGTPPHNWMIRLGRLIHEKYPLLEVRLGTSRTKDDCLSIQSDNLLINFVLFSKDGSTLEDGRSGNPLCNFGMANKHNQGNAPIALQHLEDTGYFSLYK